jgi:hypothetical protein
MVARCPPARVGWHVHGHRLGRAGPPPRPALEHGHRPGAQDPAGEGFDPLAAGRQPRFLPGRDAALEMARQGSSTRRGSWRGASCRWRERSAGSVRGPGSGRVGALQHVDAVVGARMGDVNRRCQRPAAMRCQSGLHVLNRSRQSDLGARPRSGSRSGHQGAPGTCAASRSEQALLWSYHGQPPGRSSRPRPSLAPPVDRDHPLRRTMTRGHPRR